MFAGMNLLSRSEMERIHQSAVSLLERGGILCNHEESLKYFREAGCEIGNEVERPKRARKVKFTEEIISDALDKCPSKFTIYPTSPGYKEIKVGVGKPIFMAVLPTPYIWDIDTDEIRTQTLADLVSMARILDACEDIDAGTSWIWPCDVVPRRAYERYGTIGALVWGTSALHCGKPQNHVLLSGHEKEVSDVLHLWEIAAGGKEALRKKPVGYFWAGMSPPLFLEGRVEPKESVKLADVTVEAAKAGVPISAGVGCQMGLSSPVTVAGTLVQSVAEILALVVEIQTINPGNPMMMNEWNGTTDMMTGANAWCRPEAVLLDAAFAAMGRYYNIPVELWQDTSSPMADSQAGWERMGGELFGALAGADVIASVGSLGNGQATCPRQLVIENEIAGWIRHLLKGIDMREEMIPLDLMIRMGTAPGANFLGTDHTKKLYKSALWGRSSLTNALTLDAWIRKGKRSLWDRAAESAKEILKKHEPNIPESLQKEYRDYMLQVLEREGIKGDTAKEIMGRTFWRGYKVSP